VLNTINTINTIKTRKHHMPIKTIKHKTQEKIHFS
jgi:hypothetical protein